MLILQMFFPAFFIINFDNWSFVSGFIMPDRTGQHSDCRMNANQLGMSKYDPRYLASVMEPGLNFLLFFRCISNDIFIYNDFVLIAINA